MSAASGQPIPLVVQQHVEEAAILRNIRAVLVRAPHVKLHHLRRLDDRLAAHLDGLAVAGEFGRRLCESALANPESAKCSPRLSERLKIKIRNASTNC